MFSDATIGAPATAAFCETDHRVPAPGRECPISRSGRSPSDARPGDVARIEVELACSHDYSETLRISPIPALTDAHDLLIESQLRSAADPAARHRRHRLVITRDYLQGLIHQLQSYLDRIDASAKPQERPADCHADSRPHDFRR